MKKVAVILQKGFEEVEAIAPIDLLRRANIVVDLVSLNNTKYVLGSHNMEIKTDVNIDDVDFNEYDCIFLTGGGTTMEYLKNDKLKETIIKFNKNNKLIVAICAAPAYLAVLGILENKKATCYPTFKNYLLDNKVDYIDDTIILDNNILTARAVSNSFELGLEIIYNLCGKEIYNDICEKTVY